MAQVAMIHAMIHARSSGGFLDHLFGAAVPSDLCAAFHQPCQGEFGGGKEGISGGFFVFSTPEKWCLKKSVWWPMDVSFKELLILFDGGDQPPVKVWLESPPTVQRQTSNVRMEMRKLGRQTLLDQKKAMCLMYSKPWKDRKVNTVINNHLF